MTTALLFSLAFGLAMDAFAVSLTNGMLCRSRVMKTALGSGVAFGLSQGLMPLAGYFAGLSLGTLIASIDHWIALILLGVIGGKMIVEARSAERASGAPRPARALSMQMLFLQALATSIDALAVGVGLGVMQVNIVTAVSIIAAVTFICCFCGVLIGRKFGGKLQDKAEIFGGVILILIGIHIFCEHLCHGAIF